MNLLGGGSTDKGFIGRESELAYLEEVLKHGPNRACSVYGRRRVGKSTLLRHFCKGKRSINLQFENSTLPRNLRILSAAVTEFSGEGADFESFSEALDAIAAICSESRTVVVLDEYPFMVKCMEGASAVLQHFIDTKFSKTDSMLIICGSSISVMQEETTEYGRPLYGRFPHRIELKGFGFEDCRRFNPQLDDLDALMLYLTLGGIPMYHALAYGNSYWECLENLFFRPLATLRDEGDGILSREFGSSWKYNGVLAAIGVGATNLTDISQKSGLKIADCKNHLEKLKAIRIVAETVPMLNAPKGPNYYIADDLMAFRAEVLSKYPDVVLEDGGTSLSEDMGDVIRTFLGRRFEHMCADYMRRNYTCTKVGRWWGSVEGETTDFDIVADVRRKRVMYLLVGECKFRTKAVGFETLNTLSHNVSTLLKDRQVLLALFSVSGFSDELREHAAEAGWILLVGPEEITGRRPAPELPVGS